MLTAIAALMRRPREDFVVLGGSASLVRSSSSAGMMSCAVRGATSFGGEFPGERRGLRSGLRSRVATATRVAELSWANARLAGRRGGRGRRVRVRRRPHDAARAAHPRQVPRLAHVRPLTGGGRAGGPPGRTAAQPFS
eukprot:scaffold1507_cov246-Prasinococcus_capsulatus_cf.AAC.2